MALLSFDDEAERAKPDAPFSNSTDGCSWMAIWCEDCRHEADCPLLLLAITGFTPAAWQERDHASLNRYICLEFEHSEAQQ